MKIDLNNTLGILPKEKFTPKDFNKMVISIFDNNYVYFSLADSKRFINITFL